MEVKPALALPHRLEVTASGWGPFVEVKTLVSDYPGPFLAVSITSPVNFIQ